MRNNLLLVIEEVLGIYRPRLGAVTLDVTVSYSEKQERLAVTLESTGLPGNPLETADLPNDLGLMPIQGLTENLIYRRNGEKNHLKFLVK